MTSRYELGFIQNDFTPDMITIDFYRSIETDNLQVAIHLIFRVNIDTIASCIKHDRTLYTRLFNALDSIKFIPPLEMFEAYASTIADKLNQAFIESFS